jgi:hypothetical protein
VAAGTGYDTVTGLGAPLWPKIVDRVLDPLAWPTAKASINLTSPHSSSSPYRVKASWTGTPATGGLDVQNAAVHITQVGHSGSVFSKFTAPANSSYSFTAQPGSTYKVSVTAYDLAGTTSITKTSTLVVPIDDKAFNFLGSWQHKTGGGDFAGSLAQTSHRGATATISARGKTYSVLVHTGPSFGRLVISQNGSTKKVTFFHSGSVSNRRFDFSCQGSIVNVDALYVAR